MMVLITVISLFYNVLQAYSVGLDILWVEAQCVPEIYTTSTRIRYLW